MDVENNDNLDLLLPSGLVPDNVFKDGHMTIGPSLVYFRHLRVIFLASFIDEVCRRWRLVFLFHLHITNRKLSVQINM